MTDRRRAFVAACITLVIARWATLIPGYKAIDDYYLLPMQNATWYRELTLIFPEQGRLGAWLLLRVLTEVGVHPMHSQPLMALFGIAAMAAAAVCVVELWQLSGTPAIAVAALFCAHPYLAEMQTFQTAQLSYTVAIFGVALGLRLAQGGRWLYGGLAVGFGICIYQPALAAGVIMILFAWLARRQWQPVAALGTGVALHGAVLLTQKLSTRSVPLAAAAVSDRAGVVAATLRYMLFGDGVLLTPVLRGLLLALAACAIVTRRSLLQAALTALVCVLSLLACLLPSVALHDFFIPPRVLAPVAVLWAGCLALALQAERTKPVLFTLAAVLVLGGIGRQQHVFADQRRVNEMDMMNAARIVDRIERLDVQGSVTQVAIIGYPYRYAGTSTATWDLNASALQPPLGQAAVLSEISGKRWRLAIPEQQALARALCANKPKWPAEGAVFIDQQLAIVCF